MARVPSTSTASKERLERISHHFLSESAGGPASAVKAPVLVPVVAVPGSDAFPFERLTQALLTRGRPAAVLDARGDVQGTSRPDPSTKAHRDHTAPSAPEGGGGGLASPTPGGGLRAVIEAARALSPLPEICLVPVSADDWPVPDAFERAVVPVPTDRDGVREAYLSIKHANAAGLTGPVGIVMTGAPDATAAERHFHHLADALWHFLGIEAISYGALPGAPPPHAPVDLLGPDPEARMEEAMAGVARLLAADLPAVLPSPRAKAQSAS